MNILLAIALSSDATAAQSCWTVTGWTNADVAILTTEDCQTQGNMMGSWLQADSNSLTSDDIWLDIDHTSDIHMVNNAFQGTPTYVGSSGGTPTIEVWGSSLYYLSPDSPDPCALFVTWWDYSPVYPTFDGYSCPVLDVPAGETGFIHNNGFYITPDTTVPLHCDVGSFDSENCYIGTNPSGSTPYLYQNRYLMITYQNGGGCGLGTSLPSWGGCFIGEINPHATPFIWNGNLYTKAIPVCNAGSYDGANCLIGTVQPTRTAYIWPNSAGTFYYKR